MKNIDIVLVSISSPILIGVYRNSTLIDTIKTDGKISDTLSSIFENLLLSYDIDCIVYTNSPGNYLSIKLTYIYLKTLSIAKNICIKSVDGFFFNQNNPIKGIMGKFFIKEDNDNIVLTSLQTTNNNWEFKLPNTIDVHKFSDSVDPVYIAPAVY